MGQDKDYQDTKRRVEEAFGEKIKWVESARGCGCDNVCMALTPTENISGFPAVFIDPATCVCTAGTANDAQHFPQSTPSSSPENAVADAKAISALKSQS